MKCEPENLAARAASIWGNLVADDTCSSVPVRLEPVQVGRRFGADALRAAQRHFAGEAITLRLIGAGLLIEPAVYILHAAKCVVIYCPGGRRTGVEDDEVIRLAKVLLPLRFALLHLDVAEAAFPTSRTNSVRNAVDCLRSSEGGSFERVALWGRSSVGASAAMRCAVEDPTVAALVCDSMTSDTWSFSQELSAWWSNPLGGLKKLAQRLPPVACDSVAATSCADVGSGSTIVGATSRSIEPQDEAILDVAMRCFVPAFFIHSEADTDVRLWHSQALHKAYGGESQVLIIAEGTHDACRPTAVLARAALHVLRGCCGADESDSVTNASVAYLNKLVLTPISPLLPREPAASEQEIDQLLRVGASAVELRRGILLAALRACPALSEAAYASLPLVRSNGHFAEREDASAISFEPGSAQPILCVMGSVVLPTAEAEVIIAWTFASCVEPWVKGIAAENSLNSSSYLLGTAHFVRLGIGSASIIEVRLFEACSEEDVGVANTRDPSCRHSSPTAQQQGCKSVIKDSRFLGAGLRVVVETLVLVQLETKAVSRSVQLKVSRNGSIDFTFMGENCAQSLICSYKREVELPPCLEQEELSLFGALSAGRGHETPRLHVEMARAAVASDFAGGAIERGTQWRRVRLRKTTLGGRDGGIGMEVREEGSRFGSGGTGDRAAASVGPGHHTRRNHSLLTCESFLTRPTETVTLTLSDSEDEDPGLETSPSQALAAPPAWLLGQNDTWPGVALPVCTQQGCSKTWAAGTSML